MKFRLSLVVLWCVHQCSSDLMVSLSPATILLNITKILLLTHSANLYIEIDKFQRLLNFLIFLLCSSYGGKQDCSIWLMVCYGYMKHKNRRRSPMLAFSHAQSWPPTTFQSPIAIMKSLLYAFFWPIQLSVICTVLFVSTCFLQTPSCLIRQWGFCLVFFFYCLC